MNEFNANVGKKIRKLREENGYTREELAERASINDKFLYEVETGKKGLSAQKLFGLSCAFGVSMDYFVADNVADDCAIINSPFYTLDEIEKRNLENIIHKLVLLSKKITAK